MSEETSFEKSLAALQQKRKDEARAKKEDKIKKDIAHTERNFLKGDISAGYQLYLKFENGVFEKNSDGNIECLLDKNPLVAEQYLSECNRILNETISLDENGYAENKIYLANLNLSDFRKFKTLKIKFDKKLTVFIGDNGAGKTTIVDAISKAISWIASNIVKKGGRGRPLLEHDVNIDSMTYAEANVQIKIGEKSDYTASLRKTVKGAKDSKDSELEALEELAGLFRIINNYNINNGKSEQNLPLLVSYSVNRTNIKSNKTFNPEKISSVSLGSRFDAYDKATDGSGNFSDFSEWFMMLHNLAGDDLKRRMDSAKKKVDALSLASADHEDSELWDIFSATKLEYEKLNSDFKSKELHIKNFEIVKKAILTTIPSFTDIFVDKSSGRVELKVETDGQIINVFQTSQGQRVLLSVIADMVRRLIMLNPSLNNPLLGQGIALIDEVELHLHPKWQQGIIKSLTDTFPNIQFILTTHSPQVLSTVDKTCIRQFIEDEYGNIQSVPPKFQTKGVRSADILGEIMDTNSVPDIEEAHLVDHFSELLLLGRKNDAEKILERLYSHFGNEHPVIKDCENKIKIFEMKERVQLKKKERMTK